VGKKFYSNASWSKIKDTQDDHAHGDSPEKNREYAQSICDQMLDKWGQGARPCDVRGACLKAWVTDEEGNAVK
jgi:hypothetical protein